MAASGEKRGRRKPLPAPSATIPGIEMTSAEATPPLPGLPGAAVPARAGRRSAKAPTPAATVSAKAPVPVAAPNIAPVVEAAAAAQAETVAAAEDVAETVMQAAETAAETVATTAEAATTAIGDTAEAAATAVAQTPAPAAPANQIAETQAPETQAPDAPAPELEAPKTPDTAANAAFAQQETTIMDTVQNTAEKTQAFFADASERSKGAMEKGAKLFQEMTEFGKGNVEAVVESSKIAARGFETMGQDAAAYMKTSFEDASQALRTLATIKSPTELMKFQADYLRSSFDAMVAQTSRGAEASLKLAGEVAQPISNRVAVAAEKLKVNA